jgi:phage gp36-like protein
VFTVPLASWGDDLRRCVVHIASWDLMCRRGFDPENPADQAVRLRYMDAIKWLERVAAGTVTPTDLPEDDDEDEGSVFEDHAAASDPERGW